MMKKIILCVLIATSAMLHFTHFANAQMQDPVKWTFTTERVDNQHVNLIIDAAIEKDWHLYSQYFGQGGPMPLLLTFNDGTHFKLVGKASEQPEPTDEYDDIFAMHVKYFTGKARIVQKVQVIDNEAFTITGTIEGQACHNDGACIPLTSDMSFAVRPVAGDQEAALPVPNNDNIEETKIDTIATTADTAGVTASVSSDKGGTPILVTKNDFATTDATKDNSLWSFFFISLLFGIIAILTPCVFPMIPMTISFFMQGAGNKFNSLLKALIFGVSIMLLYTLLGVIVSLTSAGANLTTVLSTHWIPNLIFFLLFLVFAASLFGMFEIILPSGLANRADSRVDKGGLMASFFMALTTVIISFSCTGPIIGALLVKAASGNVLEPTIGMLGFGLGFALPFTILAIAPNWIKKLPKSGGWLNSVKVIMGFIILAFSLKYFSNIDQNYHLGILSRDVYLAIWIIIFVLMGMYLLGKIRFKNDSEINHIGFMRMLLATCAFVFALYLLPGMFGANLTGISGLLPPKSAQQFDLAQNANNATSHLCNEPKYHDVLHNAYNVNGYFDYQQGFECAKSQNKPVLLYFTGHSCANCKKMQAAIWSDATINEYLNNKLIMTTLYVDEKSINVSEGEQFVSSNDGKLKQRLGDVNADIEIVNFKINTQPFYVLMSPDGAVLTEPMKFNDDPDEFLKFLKTGITNFESMKDN